MSAESACYATLSGAAPVIALTADRIYPDFVPDDKALPAIAINRTETEFIQTIHGAAPVASKVSLEVWCMASTRNIAEQLGDLTLTSLSAGDFLAVDRRPEFDVDTEIFAVVLTVVVWQ